MKNNFMTLVQDTLNEETTTTENGAIAYKTSGDQMVDFNFAVGSMRMWDEDKIYHMFIKFFVDDKITGMKYLFYLRDREQGIGERKTFRAILKNLANDYPDCITSILELVPQFGRWDDLFALIDTKASEKVFEFIAKQYSKDFEDMNQNKPISLLPKWMPSVNTSSAKTRALAKRFCKEFGWSEKKYRKILSKFRNYLKVVETQISANKWSEVDYNAVPSKANILYKNAFLNHDEDRRTQYLLSLMRNEDGVKINAGVLFPYDIVSSYRLGGWGVNQYDESLEQLWRNLPDFVNGEANTLVIRDGSGSMTSHISSNSSVTALDVATALTIYFSERSKGEFKDRFITFSASPKFIDLSKCKSLHSKLTKCYAEDDCTNTNLEKTFNLILKVAIENHLSQEELPKNVLIVSDMEFDRATTCNWYNNERPKTLMDGISETFKNAGYNLPKLIFWNVNSRTNTIPVQKNDAGVILVSGFSAAIAKMVLSGEVDPLKALLGILNSERYKCVEYAMKGEN